MATSPGTSVPTLFGFAHPISGLCGISGRLRPYVSLCVACIIAFWELRRRLSSEPPQTSLNLHVACILLSDFDASSFGTALNQPCTLPAHCFDTHFLARSFQLPLSFYTNARAHTATRALRVHALSQEALTGAVLNARALVENKSSARPASNQVLSPRRATPTMANLIAFATAGRGTAPVFSVALLRTLNVFSSTQHTRNRRTTHRNFKHISNLTTSPTCGVSVIAKCSTQTTASTPNAYHLSM